MKNLQTFEEFINESFKFPEDFSKLNYDTKKDIYTNVINEIKTLQRKLKVKGSVKDSGRGIYLIQKENQGTYQFEWIFAEQGNFKPKGLYVSIYEGRNWRAGKKYINEIETTEEFLTAILNYDEEEDKMWK